MGSIEKKHRLRDFSRNGLRVLSIRSQYVRSRSTHHPPVLWIRSRAFVTSLGATPIRREIRRAPIGIGPGDGRELRIGESAMHEYVPINALTGGARTRGAAPTSAGPLR